MKTAFVTTCRDRLANLQTTLLNNVAMTRPEDNYVFIVLDYNCSQGSFDWVRRTMVNNIHAGIVKVYREFAAPRFIMSHAKNVAIRLAMAEQADIIVNVDADSLLDQDYLSQLGNLRHVLPGNPQAVLGVISSPGGNGRIAASAAAMAQLGGYDEHMNAGWGYEDCDLIFRAEKAVNIKCSFVNLDHRCVLPNCGPSEAGQQDVDTTIGKSRAIHICIGNDNLLHNRINPNGSDWGKATLIDWQDHTVFMPMTVARS